MSATPPASSGAAKSSNSLRGRVLARAFGTRALRAPIPGAQGAKDTRDPDRAMTQALGRALGLMGYADRESASRATPTNQTRPA
jgi:hypothetical protein